MVPPVGKPDLVERVHRRVPPGLLVVAAIEQGQLHIFQRRCAGEQVEALKDEAEIFSPQQGALIAVEIFDMDALEQERAGGWHVEAAENVHHRRFA